MGKEYRAKVFKSGNSVALRLPAALGFKDGDEMILREDGGNLGLEPIPVTPKKIDLTGIYGSIPGLKQVERLSMEPRELDWDGKLLRK
jgi:antitoxin VapB